MCVCVLVLVACVFDGMVLCALFSLCMLFCVRQASRNASKTQQEQGNVKRTCTQQILKHADTHKTKNKETRTHTNSRPSTKSREQTHYSSKQRNKETHKSQKQRKKQHEKHTNHRNKQRNKPKKQYGVHQSCMFRLERNKHT